MRNLTFQRELVHLSINHLLQLKLSVFVAQVTQHQLLFVIFDAIGSLIQHPLECSACGMPRLLGIVHYGGSVLFAARPTQLPQIVDVAVDMTAARMVNQMAPLDCREKKWVLQNLQMEQQTQYYWVKRFQEKICITELTQDISRSSLQIYR